MFYSKLFYNKSFGREDPSIQNQYFLQDFFNYPSGSISGLGNWTYVTGDIQADGLGNIFPNYSPAPSRSLFVYDSAPNNDQYAELVFGSTTPLGLVGTIGPSVRSLKDSLTCYTASWDRDTSILYLIAFNSGAFSVMGTQTSKNYIENDILRIEVTGQGSSIRVTVKEYTGSWNTVFNNISVAANRQLNSGFLGIRSQYAAQSLKVTEIRGGNL